MFGSKREAEAVARRLEVGTANVNDVLVGFLASDVPMGGWKDSGIGFRHGEYGIKKFVRPESIVSSRFITKREALYFPYTEKRRAQLRKIDRLLRRPRLAPPVGAQAATRPIHLGAKAEGRSDLSWAAARGRDLMAKPS